ncbi:MAG: hypothetical protein WCI72_04290 [archaeon]
MIYTQIYNVNRRMHLRPYQEVVGKVIKLEKRFEGLEVKLRNEKNNVTTRGDNLLECMAELDLEKGAKVTVIIAGEFSENFLRRNAESIGNLFLKNDDTAYLSN